MYMNNLSRRTFLKLSATTAGGLLLGSQLGLAQEAPTTTADVANNLRVAAQAFLDTLGTEQATTQYAFRSAERFDWHWNFNHQRDGLMLNQMNEAQRAAALALIAAGTSPVGFQQVLDTMYLQTVLGRDGERFAMAIFGDPNDNAWGWRFEGHHLSMNVTVVDGRVSMTPLFLGAQPTTVMQGQRQGLQVMKYEEESARALMLSLGSAAIFDNQAPGQHYTQRETQVRPFDAIGVQASNFDVQQMSYMESVLGEYLAVMPAAVSGEYRRQLDQAGVGNINFAWAGAQVPLAAHYYLMQNDSFLLEFDNSRNSATHIHSVWRDFENDFGLSWL